jgi:hypothetical protein
MADNWVYMCVFGMTLRTLVCGEFWLLYFAPGANQSKSTPQALATGMS